MINNRCNSCKKFGSDCDGTTKKTLKEFEGCYEKMDEDGFEDKNDDLVDEDDWDD